MTAEEQWRHIPGWPTYVVSSLGRVASLRKGQRRLLRPWTNQNGYLYICLCADGRKQKRTVHTLVAEAFIGPRMAGQVVRHLDGQKQRNEAANLAIGTPSENLHDSVQHGTHAMVNRTHCPSDHEYTPENTRLYQGRRFCRACAQRRSRESSQRRALRAAGIAA